MLRRSLTVCSAIARKPLPRSSSNFEKNDGKSNTKSLEFPSWGSPDLSTKPLPPNPASDEARITDVGEISIFPAFLERLDIRLRPTSSRFDKTKLVDEPSPPPELLLSAGLPPQTPGEPMVAIKQEIRRFTAGSQKLKLITHKINSRPDSLRSSMLRSTPRPATSRATSFSFDGSQRTSSVLQTTSKTPSAESLKPSSSPSECPSSPSKLAEQKAAPRQQLILGHLDVFLSLESISSSSPTDTEIGSYGLSFKFMDSRPGSPSSWSTAASVATTVTPDIAVSHLTTKAAKWTPSVISQETDGSLHKSHAATFESTEILVEPRRFTVWNFPNGNGGIPRDSLNPPPPGGWRLSEVPIGLNRETSVKRSRMRRRFTAWKTGFKHWTKTKVRGLGKIRRET